MQHKPYGVYERAIKRPLDCLLSLFALIVFSPVIGIIAILVRVKLGSPVIFAQNRPGKDAKTFKLYKFRTMTDLRNQQGELLSDEERLTEFGRKLRSTSLDELLELINIIKGDMAIVGPRPLLVKYLPYYTTEQRRRHVVRPGLTGYAQVHGRNNVSWEERFKLDVEYTSHITFAGDMKIILETIVKVIKREGISSESCATMEDFVDYCNRNSKVS